MLTDKDVGKTVGLTVTAADGAGATSAYASLVGPIAGRKPLLVSTAQPLVAGIPVQGKPVQVTTGAWSPSPTSVTYSWRRCNANGRVCAPIPDARDGAYTVAAADVGHALVALVEATFGGMRQSALSTATTPVIGDDIAGPTHSALPSISGLPVSGTQLSGSVGAWRGVGTLTYRYQWYRCDSAGAHCLSIHGATAATYRAVRADESKTLGFAVRATDSTGSAAAYSTLFGPIAPPQPPITPVAPPLVTGSPHPGSTLAVDTGRWEPNPDALGYEWRRCNANGRLCAPIEGATEPSYTVTTKDVGHTVVAVVSARAGTATWSTYGSTSQLVR
jgi:hypothetical protein